MPLTQINEMKGTDLEKLTNKKKTVIKVIVNVKNHK